MHSPENLFEKEFPNLKMPDVTHANPANPAVSTHNPASIHSSESPDPLSEDSPRETEQDQSTQPIAPEMYLKKGRGRSPADGSLSKSDKLIPIPVPSPPYRKFNTGAGSKSQTPSALINWYYELPQWAKDRLVCYVEREWPILIRITREDKSKAIEEGKEVEHNYIDKLIGPPEKVEKLLDMYGAGDYKLTINDVAQKDRHRTLAQVWVKENWRDIRTYPPTDRRIDNTDNVDLTDPSNRSYVEFLRARGKLPEQGRNAEMAEAAAANREITGVLGKVLDKVLDDKRDKGNNDTTATVVKEIMGVMGDVNKQAATVMRDAYTRSTEGVNNPMEALRSVIDVVKELRPENGGGSNTDGALLASFMTEIREMNKTIIGIQNERIQFAEKIAMEARNKTENPQGGEGGAGGGGLVGSIDMILAVAGKLGLKFGGMNGGEATATAWKDLIPDILSGVNSLFSTGVTAWQTKVYADQMERARTMGYPTPAPSMPNPPAPTQSRPTAIPEAPASTQAVAGGDDDDMNFIKFMEEIKRPLLNHINRNLGGAAFAEWMIDSYDEATYEQVREQGKDTLIMALKSYPPIAKELMGKDSIVEKFAEEFCNPPEDQDQA